MIQREGGNVAFVCDACPETLITDSDDFAEANAARKRAGWKTEKVGDDWLHLCPSCKAEDRS